jgi:hypothetical protein
MIGALLMLVDVASATDTLSLANIGLDDFSINAVTTLTISGALTSSGSSFKLQAEDCFRIQVGQPYDQSKTIFANDASFYATFPTTAAQSLEADSLPAGSTFERKSETEVEIVVKETSQPVDFKLRIKGFVNPYSRIKISDDLYVRHYVGCGATPTVCSPASCKPTPFD